jgi:hypothetical protein
MAILHLSVYFLAVTVAYVAYKYFTPASPPAPYPPGPKPVPILGNVFNLTSKELWLEVSKWAKDYGQSSPALRICSICWPLRLHIDLLTHLLITGPVNYISVVNQGLLFLHTPEAVNDLLEKRGTFYSDKPHLTMAGDL